MAVSPLDLLRRQAESAVRREVSRQTSQVRSELSLVRQVNRMSRRAGQKIEDTAQAMAEEARRPRKAGELAPEQAPQSTVVCADGYRRRSPVQPYRCPKVRRWKSLLLRWGLLFALGLALGLLFWRSGLLRMF